MKSFNNKKPLRSLMSTITLYLKVKPIHPITLNAMLIRSSPPHIHCIQISANMISFDLSRIKETFKTHTAHSLYHKMPNQNVLLSYAKLVAT